MGFGALWPIAFLFGANKTWIMVQYPTVSSFLEHYDKIRRRTQKILAVIRPEHLGFRLAEGQFSIGDLARHIPLLEIHFYQACLKGNKPSYQGCGEHLAPTLAAITDLYGQAGAKMHQLMEGQAPDFMTNKCQIPSGEISVYKWARLILEHEIHHRGQIYILLSAQGVRIPDIFGMSSEDITALGH
jgi:uncharacterized damage-inducible protein DinB